MKKYTFEEFKKMIEEADNIDEVANIIDIYLDCEIENHLELSGILSAKASEYDLYY